MSNIAAIVKNLVGQVFAVSVDGLKRQIFEGERLLIGEQVITGLGGEVTLQLAGGDEVKVASNSSWQAAPTASESDEREPESELEQALAAGLDPTTDLEAPAAGPSTGGGNGGAAGGGHSFVLLDETGQQLDPTVGFKTEGLAFASDINEETNGGLEQDSVATDGPPTITIPDTDGAANATDSTLPETAGATAGSFSVSAEAGIASISVGGTTLTLAQLNNLASVPVTPINTGEGSLQITAFNAATGVVSYTYDPSVLTHSAGAAITDSIAISVTDANGVTRGDNLDIAITDSTPSAVNDVNSITEDAAPNSVTGNVLGNDSVGADANATPVTAGVFSNASGYGTLTLNSDGSYSYALNNGNAAVNALNDGQSLTDSFTYTLTDGDGSSTTATLVITINGRTDGPPTISIPDTDGPANNTDSTVPETAGATPGNFTVTAEAGIASINVGGTILTLAQLNTLSSTPVPAIDTGEGILQITAFNAATGVVSYTYDPRELNHSSSDPIVDSIVLSVTDNNGVSRSDTLDIAITDTAPTISINDVTVNEDAGTMTFTVSLSHATTAPVTFSYATSNGSATAGADYSASSGNASIATGATTATITVAIADDFLKEGNETFNVSLSNLSGNVAAIGNDLLGIGTITDSGSTPPTESITAVDTVYAVINGPASVIEGATTSDYTVRLVDQFGNPVTVASATNVTVRFTNGSAEDNDYQYGNGMTATFTIAAGASSVSFPVSTVDDLFFESDETFSVAITGVADTGAFERVTIGVSSSVTTTILNNDTLSVGNTAGDDDDVNENRDNISGNDIQHTGTISPVGADITLSIDASGASGLTSNHQAITYAWSAASRTLTASTVSGTVFTVTLSANGDSYAFKQFQAIDHAVIAGEAHSLNIPLTLLAKDSAGNQLTTAGFSITIADDAPSVSGTKVITTVNDGNYSESGFLAEATLSNDVTGITWNTAGLPSLVFEGKPVLYVDHGNGTLTGQLADGTLIFRAIIDPATVNANNSPQYSFELLNSVGRLGVQGAESTYTVISGGNINHLKLGFGDYLIDSMTAVSGSGATSTVNTNNNWIGVGGNWFNPGEKLSMAFTDPSGAAGQVRGLSMLVEGQGNSPYTVNWKVTAAIDANGTTVTYSGSVSGSGNGDMPFSIPLQNGALYFTNLDISSASGDFRIAFSGVTANNYFADIPLDLSYTLTDADGDTANGLIDVTLTTNHYPRATADNVNATEDTTLSGNLATNDSPSQDGGNVWALDTQASHGTARVNADGTFTYKPVGDYSGTDAFTYKITDANGDVSTAAVTINVTPVADAPTVFAHVSSQGMVASKTSLLADNFDSGTLSNWTATALFGNTFAEIPAGNGKTRTEAQLFDSVAWNGQTGSNSSEVSNFGNRWTLNDSTGNDGSRSLTYNQNGRSGSDDAQGFMRYTGTGLTTAEKAMTNYVISSELYADASSPQANGIGVVFGYTSASNYFIARWENPSADYAPTGNLFNSYPGQYQQLSLVQIVNGKAVDLAGANFNGDDWFTLNIAVSSTGITVTAKDLTDNTTTTLNYAYGSVAGGATQAPALNDIGFYSFDNDTAVRFDNLAINGGEYRYTLNTEAYLSDRDGSETLSNINLTGIPSGVVLTDTTTSSAVAVSGGAATVISGHTITMTAQSALSDAQINTIMARVTATESVGGNSATAVTSVKVDKAVGTGGDDWLEGSSANDSLNGGAGNDVLIGKAGNDTLIGGAGNDIIFGGPGNDTLAGGIGADKFVWKKGDIGNDRITDFKVSDGDRIDLHDLLQGENDGNILNYLRVDTLTSTLQISSTGNLNASGSNADVTIKLEDGDNRVDLSSYGSTSSDIVNSLIAGADPIIKVDHS